MTSFPQASGLDSSLALLREGYTFGTRRFARHGTDVFTTRIMLRPTVYTMGEDAARMFYHPGRFTRKRAMPPTVLWLLQDKGSVQQRDGAAHRRRKDMFMSLMGPAELRRLGDLFDEVWLAALRRWEHADRVVLHDAVQEVLCRAVCRWTGVSLSSEQVRRRTDEFAAMIDGAGSIGPRNWRGLLFRMRSEHWMRDFIGEVRAGAREVPEGSAAHVVAWHRDEHGDLLDVDVAAVELINVLRPTVAVARYITFAALALHVHPEAAEQLAADDGLTHFVHEVRRYYPFFPFVGGRVREPFTWRGARFDAGQWVLLDLYTTNHDERLWDAPGTFRPKRFRDWNGSAFNFIPQGAGRHETTHRCAGEWITIELVKRATRLLTTSMTYEVPPQDLQVDLSRMPARPASGFVIRRVRPAN